MSALIEKQVKPDLSEAQRLLNTGFHLVALHKMQKRPVGNAWNDPGNCVKAIDNKATGYGFPLALNNRCSIDPDQVEMARTGFKAWGFSLEDVMAEGVRTASTRPGSGGRSVFHADDALAKHVFTVYPDSENPKGITVLELRAKSPNLQDCVPGVLYEDNRTGKQCTQTYVNGKTLSDKPNLPKDFRKFWTRMSEDFEFFREKQKQFCGAVVAKHSTTENPLRYLPSLDTDEDELPFPAPGTRTKFNDEHDVEKMLKEYGYKKASGGNWTYEGATGAPGIHQVPGTDNLWRSFHGSDPLLGRFDAWAMYVQLEHSGDVDAAIIAVDGDPVDDFEVLEKLTHPLADYRSPIPKTPPQDDMLIEGVITAKVSFLGAYAGAGKTTAMPPLVAIVAGLHEVEGMDVMGWRRVVYVSEHPEQFELSLKALAEHWGIKPKRLADRVKVVTAKRMSAKAIAKAVPDYRELAVDHTEAGVTVSFMPWVVIDTQAATLDLESENENAEASKAMAVLKTKFDGIPLTLIAHTAKAHKRGDVDAMTIRGAGAFEADSNQVMLLSYDKDTAQRFIEIGIPKHRFTATVDALAVEFHTAGIDVMDRFKRVVRRSVGFCTLTPVSAQEKAEIKENAKHAADVEEENNKLQQVLDIAVEAIATAENNKELMTRTGLKNAVLGRRVAGLTNQTKTPEYIRTLVERGALKEDTEIATLKDEGWTVKTNQKSRLVVVHTTLDDLEEDDEMPIF